MCVKLDKEEGCYSKSPSFLNLSTFYKLLAVSVSIPLIFKRHPNILDTSRLVCVESWLVRMYVSEGCGAVYVREKGELRCVSADRNHAPQHRLFTRDFSFQLCIDTLPSASHTKRRDHFIFTYNKEGSLRYTVKSLFDISLQFIADHIEHVDSLVGFPEQMADKLFSAAEERHKFTEPHTAPRALQVFCEAYGELVLRSLCLRNR